MAEFATVARFQISYLALGGAMARVDPPACEHPSIRRQPAFRSLTAPAPMVSSTCCALAASAKALDATGICSRASTAYLRFQE